MPKHIYEVRSRKDHRGFDVISDVLPFGRSVGCGLNKLRMQSSTRSSTAGHAMP